MTTETVLKIITWVGWVLILGGFTALLTCAILLLLYPPT